MRAAYVTGSTPLRVHGLYPPPRGSCLQWVCKSAGLTFRSEKSQLTFRSEKSQWTEYLKDWRRTQSAANPSLSKFPDNPRFTGKKRKKTGKPRLCVGYSHTLSIIYGRIPYAMEQGILDNEQGIRTPEQGMHLLVQGIARWFGRRFKSGARNRLYLLLFAKGIPRSRHGV